MNPENALSLSILLWWVLVPLIISFRYGLLKATKVPMESGSRMVRIGVGQHDHKWFFRIDLWFCGIRITAG